MGNGRNFGKTNANRKGDSKNAANGEQKVEWKGYVNFEITAEHKALYAKYKGQGTDFLLALADDLAEGFTVKLGYDRRNKAFYAHLYCQIVGHKHAGWALVARASTPDEAQQRVAFLHLAVLEREWNVGEDETGWTDDRW